MEHVSKVSRCLHALLVPVISLFAFGMFGAVFAQVIFRYLLNHPLPWSEELARYLMVWIASLGAVEAYGIGGHVGVNALADNLPPKARKYLRLFVHLVVAVLMAVISYQGFKLSLMLGDQLSPALGLPMTWPYLSVPVGASLLFIQAIGIFFVEWMSPVATSRKAGAVDDIPK